MNGNKTPHVTSFEAKPGATVHVRNEQAGDQSFTLDYGDCGTINFVLPAGGLLRFTLGLMSPAIYVNAPDTFSETDVNVIRVDDSQ